MHNQPTPSWVRIFWNNAPNGLRIPDQCGFPREEHLPESHREHGFIIPKGYKPLAVVIQTDSLLASSRIIPEGYRPLAGG
jgi:hypothetical protein